jgi:hypothetical protein
MTNKNIQNNNVRIPNLPLGKLVDEKGMATPEEQMFRQGLLNLLQTLMGEQGIVIPSQTTANILSIQNYRQPMPGATPDFLYPCQYGTLIYNSDIVDQTKSIQVSINNGGSPLFKTITLT